MTRGAALLLASPLLLAAAPPPPAPVYKQFGRWIVACDNTRSCVARGFDDATRAQLDLLRAAGNAPARLVLTAENPVDPEAVKLDGQPLPLPKPAWSGKDEISTADPAAVDAFIAAARNGHTLTLDAQPPKDDAPRTIPLDGFTAALLLVDAVQGRPGTPTALVAARGTAAPPPAPPVPPAPRWTPPPALTAAEKTRLLKQAGQVKSASDDGCDSKITPTVFPLDATSALALRPCLMAAYQGSAVVAVLPRAGGAAKPFHMPLPGLPASATSGPDMVDPEFDLKTGTLFSSAKGRGLADCGSSEAWTWSAGAFRLKSLNYQDQCGGAEPGDWPTLFRTK